MAPSEAPPPRPHSLSVGTITGVDYDFQLAVAFVNDHTHSDLKLNDQQNLELYALFKQATLGDAKKKDQPLVFNLVKRSKFDAWYSIKGTAETSAKEEYCNLVAHLEVGFHRSNDKHGSPVKRRRPSMLSMSSMESFSSMASLQKEKPLSDQSKEELIDTVSKLQTELLRLSVFKVYKEGMVSRCRETITGEEWSLRYFEIKPGFLRIYKSREERLLRAEIPLYKGVLACRQLAFENGSGAAAGKNNHFIAVALVQSASKKNQISSLKLGADSDEEAAEWVAAIMAASDDGGPPPVKTEKKTILVKADFGLRDPHKKHQMSFLSSDNEDRQSYRGFANMILVALLISNLRAVADSVNKNGFFWSTAIKLEATLNSEDYLIIAATMGLSIFILLALAIEKASTTTFVPSVVANLLHVINCVASLAVPWILCDKTLASPLVCMPMIFAATVLFLKLISYAHTNTVLRGKWLGGEKNLGYPANLTMFDIFRFIAFPTLCYQTTYPRTGAIRVKWLMKRLGELLLTITVQGLIFNQMMLPVLLESLEKMKQGVEISMGQYVLNLAVPVLFCWLCMFYGMFHLWLNILAEVTYFGDRLYYKAWWNATRLDVYWRDWNIPVHAWLVRHVFFPSMNMGLSKPVSMFLVFFVSAVAHEVLVSVPCHTNSLYAFWGMMAQVPLIALTGMIDKYNKGSQIGNFIFWISFCIVGQPLCILLYFMEVATKF